MGFFSFMSSLFAPKEIREAQRDYRNDLRQAEVESKFFGDKMSKKEFSSSMKKDKDEMRLALVKIKEEEEKLLEEFEKMDKINLNKISNSKKMSSQAINGWFRQKVVPEWKKEEAALKRFERAGKAVKLDEYQQEGELMSDQLRKMSNMIKELDKRYLDLTKEYYEQQEAIKRINLLFEERDKYTEIYVKISKERDRDIFDKELIDQECRTFENIAKLDQEIADLYRRVTSLAAHGSPIRDNLDHMLMLIEPVEIDSKVIAERLKRHKKEVLDGLRLQGAILSAMQPAAKVTAMEYVQIRKFADAIQKKTAA